MVVPTQVLRRRVEASKAIGALEKTRNARRRELFDAQDAIDMRPDELIAKIVKQMQHRTSVLPIFVARWGIG